MNTATIEVRSADPPKDGKKQGVIKTACGEIYGVWPDKLGLLRPGRKYLVEFKERTFEGKTYRTIVKCEPAAEERTTDQGAAQQRGSQNTAEHDFVTRMLAASIQANVVETTESSLLQAVRVLRGVYKKSML